MRVLTGVVTHRRRKRRPICGEPLCPPKTFTQISTAVRPRGRVTERLRTRGQRQSRHTTGPTATLPPSMECRGLLRIKRWAPRRRVAAGAYADEAVGDRRGPGLVRWILDGVTWRRFGPRSSIAAVMGRDRCWGWLLAAVPTVAFSTHAVAETDWIRRNVTDVWMFAPEPSRNDMACGSVAPPPEAGHLTRPRAC